MRTRSISHRTTPPARFRLPFRKKERSALRGNGAQRTAFAASGLRGLASLKLAPKVGVEVLSLFSFDEGKLGYGEMYDEFFAAYCAAMLNWRGTVVADNPAERMSISKALNLIIKAFEKEFEVGQVQVNVHKRHDDSCVFQLYKMVEDIPYGWKAIPMEGLIRELRKGSRTLFQLTIDIIGEVVRHTRIPTWYNGGLEDAEYYLEQVIDEMVSEADGEIGEESLPAGYDACIADLKDQRVGKAFKAGQLFAGRHQKRSGDLLDRITEPPRPDIDDLEARLKRIRTDHPIVLALQTALALLRRPESMLDYDNLHVAGGSGTTDLTDDMLQYMSQYILLWTRHSAVSEEEQVRVDDTANNIGVAPPISVFDVSASNTQWPADPFHNVDEWPHLLQTFFDQLTDASGYERTNK